MKSGLGLAVLLLAVAISQPAKAIFNPSWERPIESAKLVVTGGNNNYPHPTSLTLNKRDGQKKPTSLTLVEDTGIRCFRAPCPSAVTTNFDITRVETDKYGSVTYSAVERKNVPVDMPGAMKRVLTLVDRRKDQSNFPYAWEVTIRHFGLVVEAAGNPTGVITIQ